MQLNKSLRNFAGKVEIRCAAKERGMNKSVAHRRSWRARLMLIAAALALTPLPALADVIQSTIQPSQGINYQVITTGPASDLGIVNMFAGNFAPDHFANGDLLPSATYSALFTNIGTTYGGNASNFALPNLSGRTIIGAGQGAGLTNRPLGSTTGSSPLTLNISNYPVSNGGSSVSFSNMQPSLALTYYICVSGLLPSAGSNGSNGSNQDPFVGQMIATASNNALSNDWVPANGATLSSSSYAALFSIIGTTYGGTASNFAVPDLRGRTVIGAGTGVGLTARALGSTTGTQSTTLVTANLPAPSGTNTTYSNMQPSIALNYIISLKGTNPSPGGEFDGNFLNPDPYLGQISLFAGNFAPGGWAICDGSLLNITSNVALFSILGTTYGGNGVSNFALPDLRGRTAVGADEASFFQGDKVGAESLSLTNDSKVLINTPTSSTPATGASSKTLAFGAVLKGADLSNFALALVSLDKTGASATNYKATVAGSGLTTFPSTDTATNTSTQSLPGKVYLSSAAYNAAATGTITIQNSGSGVTDANDVFTVSANVGMATPKATGDSTFDPANTLSAAVLATSNAYAGLSSKTTRAMTQPVGGALEFQNILGTEALILAGTPSTAKTISMNWRTRANSETTTQGTVPPLFSTTHPLITDVVRIAGTGSDLYVLQMEYNPADLPAGAIEAVALANGYINVVRLDTGVNRWLWAGGSSFSAYTQGAFADTGSPGLADDLGRRGAYISGGHHYAWAVVNVAGDFAVVPEPASLSMLALGALGLLRRKR